jgi:hypothetical protein
LWDLSARDGLTAEAASGIIAAVESVQFDGAMNRWGPDGRRRIKEEDRKAAIAAAKPRTEQGPEMQRLIALVLLRAASRSEAVEVAAKIADDRPAPTALRRDAFQIALMSRPKAERKKSAVAGLASDDAGVRNRAALYLAGIDAYRFRYVREEIYLDAGQDDEPDDAAAVGENRPFVAKKPEGVTAEAARLLVADPDPETSAAGAYLLALCGDPAGLEALVRQWREHPQDEFWTRLVCRAVTALDDDGKVPVLDEVYQRLGERGFSAREFYWTIRSLDGPNALRLRRQVRQDVGMDALRGGDNPNLPGFP